MNFDPKKTLFLIDGSSFLYRAYYGLKPLHSPSGVAVQAVFSFCRMIKKLIDTYKPEYVALVWDSKGKTTRHTIFPAYKATRQAPPSDIFEQKEFIIQFADLIGMLQVQQSGIEADDLMFSLAKDWVLASIAQGEQEAANDDQKNGVVFVTLDKDMGQALTLGQNIYLLDAFKDQFSDSAAIQTKMNVPVEKLPFYFALLGDSSDNIPGVKGIGKKTAEDLVNQFDSLEDMYDRLHEIKKAGVKTALLEQKDNAFLSFQLFLLQYTPMNMSAEQLLFNAQNWNKARPLFEELGFKSLTAGAGETKEERARDIQQKIDYWKKYNFITVTTTQQLHDMCDYLKGKGAFALDTETTGLSPLEVDLVGISFSVDQGVAYYVPCGHKTGESQLSLDEILAVLKPMLEDARYKKYLHNAKYDQLVLTAHGIELAGVALDTLIGANLIIKEWQSAGLKKLSHAFFNEDMLTFDDVVKTGKYKDFSYVPLELAALYSCADSYQTYRLVAIIEDAFKKEKKIHSLYTDIEHPLIEVLYEMEKEGVNLDVHLLHELDKKVVVEISMIESAIAQVVGKETINLNSPSQMEYLLFSVLQLPPQKKSPTGKFSTDAEVLKVLATMHPIPALIIKYRELAKLKNTYIDALPTYVNKKTRRLHTTFSQTAVATGRLASSNPNLQNIPADSTGYGIEVRAAFKAGAGRLFISADYSQIELRVLAYLSQDKNLLHAFAQGLDIHTETAARLFDVAIDDVANEQRQLGKRINFSVLYGMTPYGLSKDLGIPFKDAKKYIERYFERYPQVSAWMESVIEFCKKHEYVETFWGRRRYIPAIYEKNRTMYEEACRVAINTVAQGTAAEIMKLGMIAVRKELQTHFPESCIVLQIHDELIVSVPEAHAQAVEELVKRVLENITQWDIPLEVSTRSGADWKEITK